VRQVDRLIAVLDSGDDLECEALVVIFPREGLPAPCAFQRVIDDERDPVAVEQVAAAERWMFVCQLPFLIVMIQGCGKLASIFPP
jgi:hypothetical protein